MDKDHPLAQKSLLEWSDIAGYELATFNKTFTTYDLVTEKLRSQRIEAKFAYLSSTWDFLVESTHQTDLIALCQGRLNILWIRVVLRRLDSRIRFHLIFGFVDPIKTPTMK